MAEPLIENIAQAIVDQLETISTANGYYFTPSSVVRPVSLAGFDPKHLQIVVMQESRVKPEQEEPMGRSDWVQPFIIALVLRPSEKDTTPADKHINRFVADVEKCLMSDDSEWDSTGRINYTLDGPDLMPDNVPYDGAIMTLNVHYRHDYGDPYTNGG